MTINEDTESKDSEGDFWLKLPMRWLHTVDNGWKRGMLRQGRSGGASLNDAVINITWELLEMS